MIYFCKGMDNFIGSANNIKDAYDDYLSTGTDDILSCSFYLGKKVDIDIVIKQ